MLGVYLLVCSNLRNTQINETYSNICMQQSNKKSWKLRATPKSLMRTWCWICPSNTEQDVLSPVKGCFEFDSFWQSFLTWATLTWVIQSTRNLTIIHSLPSFSNQNHKFAAYFALKYHSHSIKKKTIDLTGTQILFPCICVLQRYPMQGLLWKVEKLPLAKTASCPATLIMVHWLMGFHCTNGL